MDLNWKHQHRRMYETLTQKLDALEGSYASPRQTLNIIHTAIIPSLAYAFAVTSCSYSDLDKWDAMIGRVIKSNHNLWRSTLTAMIREDFHSFGLGAPSIYHRHSAVALVTSLEDPSKCLQSVTMHLLTHQVAKLKALATTFLSTREGTSLPIKRQLNLATYASTPTCLHPRQQAPLSLERKQHVFRRSQAQLGITGFHDLTSANEKYIVSGNNSKTNTLEF